MIAGRKNIGLAMITLQELCDYLNDLLEVPNFSDYSENGLQVEGTSNIGKIGTAVSSSLATIQAAVDLGVHALLVHHGMFWSRDSQVITGVKREKIRLLLKHDISLLAYHLPLDAHNKFGNNWKAACDLGWSDLELFGEINKAPFGVKGRFTPRSVDTLLGQLEDYYQHSASCALGGKNTVETAALISGGAYRMLLDAANEGVDCFITGNFDEPAWHQAYEEKINFLALGHSATEKIGPKALGEHLKNQFGLEYAFIDIPNPF